ncbi:MAG: excinuclease ABC subunit UvrA [Gemmatimonadota bacterium]|nr:excinuclease ABC subunit UvrA [Gemmatimonadota bacterium]
MDEPIRIRGAQQHNLKGFDLDLPRRKFLVVTGPSGSGKSSLALDTLFAEGQRRYVESLSTYAKQFLDRIEKPRVEAVEGIAPAVAIEQRNPIKTSRSTVGTATEVHDYLRLLYARVGRTHCPECGGWVQSDTVAGAVDRTLELPKGMRFMVTFPLHRSGRIGHAAVIKNLKAMGFVRVLADGVMVDIGEARLGETTVLGVDLSSCDELLIVVDRLVADPGARDRLADSLQTAFNEGEGECVVVLAGAPAQHAASGERLTFTQRYRCPDHPDIVFPEPTPQFFSFNSPYGSCPECTGFGATLEYDVDLIVPNPKRSIDEGAVDPWAKPRYRREQERLRAFAHQQKQSLYAPWDELDESFRETVLHGRGRHRNFRGVVPFLASKESKRYKRYIRVFLRRYQSPVTCRSCGGARVRPEALRVHVGGTHIGTVSELPLDELGHWLRSLALNEMEGRIAETILNELVSRVDFLVDVGLGYVTLARQTRTLSGGEAQRITLANALGSQLIETLYVLDEPTVGLHPRDTGAMVALLRRLRDAGNTVIVVEHDSQVIRAADHVVELGPASGEKGGEVVFEGPPGELEYSETSTGRYLSGCSDVALPERHRCVDGPMLALRGARLHNLEGVDVDVPLGALTVVTGVSGSGKSTLVHDVLYRALERELFGGETSAKEHLGEAVGNYERLEGVIGIEDVVLVDQSPIGRTPRSSPVTYVKAWDEVRRVFAAQSSARQQGVDARAFSFNVPGGRCEACKGCGLVEIDMVFMADVFVPCEACGGARFMPEILDVTYKDRSIADVLELTVDEAIRFFVREDRLGRILWQLQQVGLGYLRLGQAATTLSGGEAQRLKIARELSGAAGKKGRKLYVMDEPTIGLSGEDVRKLLCVLDRLLDTGHTVLVVEHNLDVIKTADWVIDMGPGAGSRGGEVVAMGRPADVAHVPESVTGRYLKEALGKGRAA